MKTIMGVVLMGVALAGAGCASAASTRHDASSPMSEGALVVGVFDSRGVALAYGRSSRPDCMMAKVDRLRLEHDRAVQRGDDRRKIEIESEVQDLQRQIHEQVFSGTAIDQVLAILDDDLPSVAERSGVDLIVTDVLHARSNVELVDITMQMCAPFEPDDATLLAIRELLAKPAVPVSQLSTDY